jgi:hypothetical protein
MACSLELHCKYSRTLVKDEYPEGWFEPHEPIEGVFVEDGQFKLPKSAVDRVAQMKKEKQGRIKLEEILS